MAACPVLDTADGKLILSTNATSVGSVVVIGCSGLFRHKKEPVTVFCQASGWQPEPNTDCETELDEREKLLVGVFAGCAFLVLVVLLLLCCSCCFFRHRRRYRGWWGRRWSGDRVLIDRGTRRYGYGASYPRETIIRHESFIRPTYNEFRSSFGRARRYSGEFERDRMRSSGTSYPREKVIHHESFIRPTYNEFRSSFGRARRYSAEFERDRMRSSGLYPREGYRSRRETYHETTYPDDDMSTERSYKKLRRYSDGFINRSYYPRGNTEVFRRETYLPDYDFFSNSRVQNRRYSDGYEYKSRARSDIRQNRRLSTGSWGAGREMQFVSSEKPRYYEHVEKTPSTFIYAPQPIQPIAEPLFNYEYIEQPITTQYIEEKMPSYSYTATYIQGGGDQFGILDDSDVFMKYGGYEMSYSQVPATDLPRAKITELPDEDGGMKLVPYRSANQSFDPTMNYLNHDSKYDSWIA